jgi:hypothetical protein
LNSWQTRINAALRQDKIRRNTVRYRAFIEQHASDGARRFRAAAQETLEQHRREVTAFKEEIESQNTVASQFVGHLRRTAEIVQAFCVIAPNVSDSNRVGETLIAQAGKIEQGIQARAKQLAEMNQSAETYTPEEIIRASIAHIPDLKALWEAAGSKTPNDSTSS